MAAASFLFCQTTVGVGEIKRYSVQLDLVACTKSEGSLLLCNEVTPKNEDGLFFGLFVNKKSSQVGSFKRSTGVFKLCLNLLRWQQGERYC